MPYFSVRFCRYFIDKFLIEQTYCYQRLCRFTIAQEGDLQSRIRFPDGRLADPQWLISHPDHPAVQTLLREAYPCKNRPICTCSDPPLALYIRRLRGHRYVLARMPGTRCRHAPDCYLFSAEPQLSAAQIFHLNQDGMIDLQTGLPDPRITSLRQDVPADVAIDDEVQILLPLLWAQAALSQWHPAHNLHDTWATIRQRLLEAAGRIRVNGHPLQRILFVPQPWSMEAREQLRQQTTKWMTGTAQNGEHVLVIGLLRRLEILRRARSDHSHSTRHRLYLQHFGPAFDTDEATLKQCLAIDQDAWQRDADNAQQTIWQWQHAPAHGRLAILMRVRAAAWHGRHYLNVSRVALLPIAWSYIPASGPAEQQLAAALSEARRVHQKPLLADGRQLCFRAGYNLLDCGDAPEILSIGTLLPGSDWLWRPNTEATPPSLPPAAPDQAFSET